MRALPFLVALCVLPLTSLAGPGPAAAPSVLCDPACDVRVLDAASEPAMWVAPNGTVLLVANSYALGASRPCGDGSTVNVWPALAQSRDGGRTWRGALLPRDPADPTGGLLDAFPCSRSPSVAVDPLTKRILVAAVGAAGTPVPVTALWAQQSYDGGATWDRQIVLAGGGPALNEGPSLFPDTDGNGILGDNGPTSGVLLGSALGGDVMMGKNLGLVKKQGLGSIDAHAVWETVPATDGENANTTVYQGEGVRAFTDVAHTFYLGWTDPDLDVQEGHSLDYGHSFEGVRRAGHITPFDTSGAPVPIRHHAAMAIDNTRGAFDRFLYAAWADGPGAPSIVSRVSRDNGHGFCCTARVSDAGAAGLRFAPSLAVGPDGTAWAAWYDARDGGMAVYAAASADGGSTWSANVRVGPVFDARLALDEHGRADLGEHLGLAVDAQGVAHIAWTDARDGHAAVYAARLAR